MTVLVLVDSEEAGATYVDQRAALTGEYPRNFRVVTPSTWTEGLRADEVVLLTNDRVLREVAQRMIAAVARVTVTYPRRGAM